MEWIDYKEQKPTNKESRYLIEYGTDPEIPIIITAYWNGKTFYNWDWDEPKAFFYKGVRRWLEIVPPKE